MLELQDVWLIEISPGKGQKTASVRKEKCIALDQMSNCHRKPKRFFLGALFICTCSVTEKNPTVSVDTKSTRILVVIILPKESITRHQIGQSTVFLLDPRSQEFRT